MNAEDKPTIGEVTRGMAALSEQIHRLHEETMNQHHRVRNDMAAAVGAIQNDIRSMIGDVKAHDERLHAQGREIGALTEDVAELRSNHKADVTELRNANTKLLWAVIGAYGSVTLAVLGVVTSRAL